MLLLLRLQTTSDTYKTMKSAPWTEFITSFENDEIIDLWDTRTVQQYRIQGVSTKKFAHRLIFPVKLARNSPFIMNYHWVTTSGTTAVKLVSLGVTPAGGHM